MEQLSYPLDSGSKQIIKRVIDEYLPNRALEYVWNNFFYFPCLFESLDRWDSFTLGAGATVVVNTAGLVLTTAAGTPSNATTSLAVNANTIVDFSRPSRFRTSCEVDILTNMSFYIYAIEGTSNYYGFRFDGTALKGISYDGTTESTVTLLTASAGTVYVLEARFLPNNSITYFVDGVQRGVITTHLPTGDVLAIANYYLDTSNATAKQAVISYFELIHTR